MPSFDHWYLPPGVTGRVYRLENTAHPDCGPATVAVRWDLASEEHPYQWINVEPGEIRKIEDRTQRVSVRLGGQQEPWQDVLDVEAAKSWVRYNAGIIRVTEYLRPTKSKFSLDGRNWFDSLFAAEEAMG